MSVNVRDSINSKNSSTYVVYNKRDEYLLNSSLLRVQRDIPKNKLTHRSNSN